MPGVIKFSGPKQLSTLLKYEVASKYCREGATVAPPVADLKLEIGDLLALVNKKAVPLNLDGSDGSETLWGICLVNAQVLSGQTGVRVPALTDGPAIIDSTEIVWPAGADDAAKKVLREAMQGKGIKLI
ncbi:MULTISPECIES: head decoration protein [unclassified Pseudovibrio]|uniref:head decoration protein n=1 Tax=unclassified Pseudovibrio TaxID=2627060 RepID=UPI0007AE986D|nr:MULTISPECIES: head decoration protein [unclassified Pseudovibrio]KZL02272.1 hypothetical protein PsW74_01370 [Pseudovibrio sp. W74]KZL08184.1 hypothetical protein PsAD14_03331 [Pseudovibrio sp. Ad14]